MSSPPRSSMVFRHPLAYPAGRRQGMNVNHPIFGDGLIPKLVAIAQPPCRGTSSVGGFFFDFLYGTRSSTPISSAGFGAFHQDPVLGSAMQSQADFWQNAAVFTTRDTTNFASWTIVALFRRADTGGDGSWGSIFKAGGDYNGGITMWSTNQSLTACSFGAGWAEGVFSQEGSNSGFVLNVGDPYLLVASFDGVHTAYLARNLRTGGIHFTSVAGGTPGGTPVDGYVIGSYQYSQRFAQGYTAAVAYFSGATSLAQLKALADDPFGPWYLPSPLDETLGPLTNIVLFGSGGAGSFGQASVSLAAALAARGEALTLGGSSYALTAALTARGEGVTRGQSSYAATAALSARGRASAFGRGSYAMAITLAAKSMAKTVGKMVVSPSIALRARGEARSQGKVVLTNTLALKAQSSTRTRGGAFPTHVLSLFARGLAKTFGFAARLNTPTPPPPPTPPVVGLPKVVKAVAGDQALVSTESWPVNLPQITSD